MVWNTSAFQLLIISASGGFTGLFVYEPVPGPTNLVASIAPQAGTDPYGNAYQAGITSYVGGGSGEGVYSQLSGGGVDLANTSLQSHPVVMNVSGSAGVSTELNITSGVGTEAGAAASTLTLGDSGSLLGLQVLYGTDGNTYDTERLVQKTIQDQTISSITDVIVGSDGGDTPLSKHLGVGTYEIRGLITWTQGTGTVTQAMGLAGSAGLVVSHTRVPNNHFLAGSGSSSGCSSLSTIAGGQSTPAFAAGSTVFWWFDGILTVTTAGTLSVVAHCNGANTFTVNSWSKWEVKPVVAT